MNESLLKGIPPILWINLDRSKDRYDYMNNLFNKYNLINERISACDGNNYKDFSIIDDDYIQETKDKKYEIGTLCSHLKAIEYFANSDDLGDLIIITEDDLSFEYLPYWGYKLSSYILHTPKDFEILQLAQTYYTITFLESFLQDNYVLRIRKHPINYVWGAVAYAIKKSCAKKIVNKFIRKIDGKYDLNYLKQHCYNEAFKRVTLLSDYFLYKHNITYTIPLFTTNNDFDTNIHINIHSNIPESHTESKKVLSEHIKSQYEEMIKLLNPPKTARLFSVLPSITH